MVSALPEISTHVQEHRQRQGAEPSKAELTEPLVTVAKYGSQLGHPWAREHSKSGHPDYRMLLGDEKGQGTDTQANQSPGVHQR